MLSWNSESDQEEMKIGEPAKSFSDRKNRIFPVSLIQMQNL